MLCVWRRLKPRKIKRKIHLIGSKSKKEGIKMPILETNLSALNIQAYESEILKEAELPFFVPRSFILLMDEKETKELIQWETQGLRQLTAMNLKLSDMKDIMDSFIWALDRAMSMLLSPANIVSNPELVFISYEQEVILVYGKDKTGDFHEKIIRIAGFFASRKHIPGAELVFSKFAKTIQTRKPSLSKCSRFLELTMREWNGIVGK